MGRIEDYRRICRTIIEDYGRNKPSHGDIRPEVVIDDGKGHYELMMVGWDGHRRVHGCVVHLDLIGGKVWIQHDGTNRPVAEELEAAGVPREDIVLGFIPENIRHHTGYAVA